MSNPFKSKAFKAQFAEWNQILKDSGHEEIEDFSAGPGDGSLIIWNNFKFKKIDPNVFLAKEKYFARATAILDTYDFECELHHQIWWMHSEGLSIREITAVVDRKKYGRDRIHFLIQLIRARAFEHVDD